MAAKGSKRGSNKSSKAIRVLMRRIGKAAKEAARALALTPSAAYWLAAQLNIQMVGAAVTDGKGNEYRVFARERKRESVEA